MKREALIRSVVNQLRDSNIRKSVHVPRHTLHISDDNGVSKDFVVKGADKEIMFTAGDVGAIIDATMQVIIDALIHGDNVSMRGFGSIGLQYRKPRATRQVCTGDEIIIAGRYVPKFTFGNDLRMAARLYEASVNDKSMPHDLYADDCEDDEYSESCEEDGEDFDAYD